MSLDQRFEKFLRHLPVFSQLDEASRQQSQDIVRQYPQIAFQRCIICTTVHSRRFKLNQPFLIRTSYDRRYEYSREEVVAAYCVLQEAAETSLLASRFLKSLTAILQKYQVQLSLAKVSQVPSSSGSPSFSENLKSNSAEDPQPLPIGCESQEPTDIDGLWQKFINQDQVHSVASWDTLFSALDATVT
ncbi:hypothetical protein EYZ11_004862 [Aspergillus tanneri]|uniref:Uncharacterized protein n=1 Tax=Aspergillus tanneri TaxID=1220188 RepID=A0A4S3JJC2_9EURO|nr:uncharacterized protein ATNIH1004_002200 [Aspergillus tanneri]KAA8649529.1 hypothetical protein ATNIH1004_002200 [Aspergillus tanneri]THC95649.1 hypothetical protein EYZ11_004862 [Aspergillus tanneri]